MESCRVNFVHKQRYKVYNHFENGKKQIGYVEMEKLYYIVQNYSIPVDLLNSILNQNIDLIRLHQDNVVRQYGIGEVVPEINPDNDVVYNVFVADIDWENASYISNEYLEVTAKECDKYVKKVRDKCDAKYEYNLDNITAIDNAVKRTLDNERVLFSKYIKQFIEEQEVKKCEETK